jgi:hypothetical protein
MFQHKCIKEDTGEGHVHVLRVMQLSVHDTCRLGEYVLHFHRGPSGVPARQKFYSWTRTSSVLVQTHSQTVVAYTERLDVITPHSHTIQGLHTTKLLPATVKQLLSKRMFPLKSTDHCAIAVATAQTP